MANVFFVKPLLEELSDGHLFKKATALLLRVAAVLTLVGTLVLWVRGWKAVGALAGVAILGGILFQCCFALGSYMVVHAMWIRAGDIARLPNSEFTLIPIAYMGLKLAGEIYAATLVSINLGAGLLIWFASTEWGTVLGDLYVFLVPASWFGKEPFVLGAMTILLGIASAFGVLFVGYLLAEGVVVVASLANDTRRLRAVAEQQASGMANTAG